MESFPKRGLRARLTPLAAAAAAALFLAWRSQGFLFFLIQHPGSLTWESLGMLGTQAADVLFAAILFLGFQFYGSWALEIRPVDASFLAPLERFLIASALGECLTAFLIVGLSLAGFFRPWVFLLIFAGLAWGAYRQRETWSAGLGTAWKAAREPVDPWLFLCFFLIAAGLLRGAVASGAPPVDWDSLAYHLAFPKIYLRHGGFFGIAFAANGDYPLNSEMIYALCLALRDDLACHWVNWIHAFYLLLALILIGRRFLSGRAALAAAAILAVQPVFQRVLGNAATDNNVALCALLALLALLLAQEQTDSEAGNAASFLSGCLAGAAMSAKYNGVWSAAALFILLAGDAAFKRKGALKSLAFFCSGALALGSPWYLKNWIWTRNPIWPYHAEWFGGSPSDVAVWLRLNASLTAGVERTFRNWILLPYHFLTMPAAFHHAPQYLCVPLAVLFAARLRAPKPAEKKFLAFSACYLTLWFFSQQEWRYCLPVAGLFALLIAAWACEDMGRRGWFKWLPGLALFAVMPAAQLEVNNEAFPFFGLRSALAPGLSARERYIEGALGPYARLCRLANRRLPENARVFFYRDVRGYYLDREYAWGDPLNPGLFDYASLKDADDLRLTLARLGFTHVLYNGYIGGYRGDAAYYARADRLMLEVLRRDARPALMVPGYEMGIYELLPEEKRD